MMAASLTLSGSPDDYHPEHPSDFSAMNILDVNEELSLIHISEPTRPY